MLGSPGGRADDRPRRRRPKSPSARHARPKRPMQTATRFAWPVPPQIGMRDQWRECVNSVEAQRNRSRRLQLPVSVWRQPGSVDETETDPSSGSADQAWSQRGGADRRASECGDLQGARDQGSRPALARAGNAGARFSLSCPDRTSSGPVQPVARAAASTRLIVASAARQVRECVSGLLQAAQAHKGSDKVRWQSDGNHLRMLTGTRCPTPSLPRGAICVPRSRARPFAALSICCGKPQLCAVNGNGDRVGRLGWVGAAAGRFLRRSHDWCFARRAAAPIWPAQSAPRCARGRRLATVPGSCMAAEGRPGWLRVCTDCFGQHVGTGMSAIEAGTETRHSGASVGVRAFRTVGVRS